MDEPSKAACSTCNKWWRLPVLLALVLTAILFVRFREPLAPTPSDVQKPIDTAGEFTEAVSVTIDFGGDRRREIDAIPWREGMTVRDLLSAASNSEGNLRFSQQGDAATAFLTEIDGTKNEGAGGRNWKYKVNGEFGDRSFAIYELRPGDQVLWIFAGEE